MARWQITRLDTGHEPIRQGRIRLNRTQHKGFRLSGLGLGISILGFQRGFGVQELRVLGVLGFGAGGFGV